MILERNFIQLSRLYVLRSFSLSLLEGACLSACLLACFLYVMGQWFWILRAIYSPSRFISSRLLDRLVSTSFFLAEAAAVARQAAARSRANYNRTRSYSILTDDRDRLGRLDRSELRTISMKIIPKLVVKLSELKSPIPRSITFRPLLLLDGLSRK